MQALILISIVHKCCNLRPFFGILLVKFKKLVILFISPCFDSPFGDLMIFLLNFHIDGSSVLGDDGDDKLSLHILL
jgi:hypothetical protein